MKKLLSSLAIATLICCARVTPSMAQQYTTPVDYSATIGTAVVQVMPATVATTRRLWMMLQVDTSGATVSCSWTSIHPTVWGTGTFTMAGQSAPIIMASSNEPNSALNCIASAAGTLLTAQAFPQ